MPGLPSRDLAVMDPWEESYARSLARRKRTAGRRKRAAERSASARARAGKQAQSQSPPSLSALLTVAERDTRRRAELRDLSDAHVWELSLGRSRARRRAGELRFVPTPSRAKRISLGALIALTAAPSASLAESGATAPAPAGPATTTEHSILLSEGSSGRQVRLLQQALGTVKVDGVFGPETEAAVERFQAGKNLTVDGVVGPQTSAALREQTAATATFASFHEPVPGEAPATGSPAAAAVAAVDLTTNASTTAQTGGAGAQSEGAQSEGAQSEGAQSEGAQSEGAQSQESAQDGTEDKTESAVTGGAATGGTEASSTWDAVTRLQAALHLPVDGEFGPETEAAIERLQARHGLSVDGVVGPETWSVVGVTGEQTLTPPPSALTQPPSQPGGATEAGDGAAATGVGTPEAGDEPVQEGTPEAAQPTEAGGEAPEAGTQTAGAPAQDTGEAAPSSGGQTVASGEDSSEGSGEGSYTSAGGGGTGGTGSSSGEGTVARVIAAANEIATRPYVYGGGHGSFQSEGYDCSGSVSYALHGGGLINSPEDSTALESYGQSGPGKHITIYANSEHAYMVVNGRRFDTVALAEHGSRWSNSPGDDGGQFVERHPTGM